MQPGRWSRQLLEALWAMLDSGFIVVFIIITNSVLLGEGVVREWRLVVIVVVRKNHAVPDILLIRPGSGAR